MHKILLVEDDKDIQMANKKMLERQDIYTVRLALNLNEAREQIAEQVPDVIVLDIMLPDGSGLDFLKELRTGDGQGSNIPVLLLTALSEFDDVVKGLKEGGDDYLAKPYNNKVFLARIESLLRRAERVPKGLTKGNLALDIISGRAFLTSGDATGVTSGDATGVGQREDLLLTQKEFACLLLFSQNEGVIMSPEFIYESVWKQPLNNNIDTLKKTISNLRIKIEDSDYTINVSRNEGYMFERI